ncbi:hypothetical protein [Methanobrevibacter sp.]
MKYDADIVKTILDNLKKDPMRIIYTEHYLEQIEKRNIPDICVEELLENGNPTRIKEIRNSRFELHYDLGKSNELHVLIRILCPHDIILISALNTEDKPQPDNELEFEGVYDLAFDMIDMHSRHGFRYGRTIEMEQGFNIDFDSCGNPVAVEMIPASERFKLRRELFSSAQIEGRIEITPDLIRIRLKASAGNENVKHRVLEKEIRNKPGIQENTFDLIVHMAED